MLIAAFAVAGWLMTSKPAWASDAPLCHQNGASAQGKEAALVDDQTTLDACSDMPAAQDDEGVPTAPEERVTDEADPAIVTGWMWFARSPVSTLKFTPVLAGGAPGVRSRLDRPPQL